MRLHGEPATLLGPLMRQVCDWASDLVADGVCTGYPFDTYEREVERYGGHDGTRAAEMIFTADSPVAAGLLRLSREREVPYDLTTLAVLSVDDLLDSLGVDARERLGVYRQAAATSREGGKEYRLRQRGLRRLL